MRKKGGREHNKKKREREKIWRDTVEGGRVRLGEDMERHSRGEKSETVGEERERDNEKKVREREREQNERKGRHSEVISRIRGRDGETVRLEE